MYCPINKVAIGSRIQYLGSTMIVVQQFGKQNGTNCCNLEDSSIIEFGNEGAKAKDLIFDDQSRLRKGKWYYSYKAMVKVVKP